MYRSACAENLNIVKRKKLPIGIQTFAKIREADYSYVDKTPWALRLIEGGTHYFLSRPRRFGKSLLVDTLKCLFEGRKELFEGLFIYDKWDWGKTYPVIKLDFAIGGVRSPVELENWLDFNLRENQARLGVVCEQTENKGTYLAELIQKAHAHCGQKVVVLVDEYDKPILDNVERPEVAAEVREGLKNVYSVLKGQDAYLQFVFMTGVTKFSKGSLLSGMNQLKDLTLHKDYATLCGYTQNDLETDFAEHLAGVDWEKLKTWYNGYRFLGEPVYNPFDILLFIDNGFSYRNNWFETGSPSILPKLFRQRQYFLPELSSLEVGEEILDSFEVENINPITLLFQAGYLTIESTLQRRDRLIFRLCIPNQGVRLALFDQFIDAYTQRPSTDRLPMQDRLADALETGDLDKLKAHIISLFASISWRNFTASQQKAAPEEEAEPLFEYEGYYASVLHAFFMSLNIVVIPEDISCKGQADLTTQIGDFIYVMEIKRDTSEKYDETQPNPALKQILERNYAQKYTIQQAQGKQIIQLGLVFNTHARNLVAFDFLKLEDKRSCLQRAKKVKITIPVGEWDDVIPTDCPLRFGTVWSGMVDLASGEVLGWPKELGYAVTIDDKVRDVGIYQLYDEYDRLISEIVHDYVPNRLIPGSFGDYIELVIDKSGKILNWKAPVEAGDFSEFPDCL